MICLLDRLRFVLLLSVSPLVACADPAADRGESADPSGVVSVLKVETSLHRDLVENSAAVTSVTQPGIAFGINDSGNRPTLFAFDSTGAARGSWRISGARNIDWEAAAAGPCPGAATSCLYIGDVGDNDARRQTVSIYRIPEPTVPAGGLPAPGFIDEVQRLSVRYPDQPHDVEAMYVARDGSLFLITKRRLLDPARTPRPALIYRLPHTAWDSAGTVTATLVDSLPIVPGTAPGRQVTDAAVSSDWKWLAVRTYSEVFIFLLDQATGLPARQRAPTSCTILGLEERQGEGIGWWWDNRRLVLTSEGQRSPLFVVECGKPLTRDS
jgi:hypothetical protein